jgi:hypothetical protein
MFLPEAVQWLFLGIAVVCILPFFGWINVSAIIATRSAGLSVWLIGPIVGLCLSNALLVAYIWFLFSIFYGRKMSVFELFFFYAGTTLASGLLIISIGAGGSVLVENIKYTARSVDIIVNIILECILVYALYLVLSGVVTTCIY